MKWDNWYGHLTIENISNVSELIKAFLLSAKSYTFVSTYKYKNFEPETRINQRLEYCDNGTPFDLCFYSSTHASFMVCDTYGVWMINAGLSDEITYIKFDYSRLTIHKKYSDRSECYWQITLEGDITK